MKITCGIDIIEVKRIRDSIEKFGNAFLEKIYTPDEIEYCNSKKNRYQHFAARFAAKEAIFKAISEKLKNKYDIEWNEIEILSDESGKPNVNLRKKIEKIEQIDVSLSHLEEYATANCVVIFRKED